MKETIGKLATVVLFGVMCLLLANSANSQEPDVHKVWVHKEYDSHADRVYFIQDLETGTRCYAITNSQVNASGYAISCVAAK